MESSINGYKNGENLNDIKRDEKIIQLKFFDSINIISNSYKSKSIRFKISSFYINKRDCDSRLPLSGDINDSNLIEISVMNENDYEFKEQEPNGCLYNSMDFIIFRTKASKVDEMAFMIDLYSNHIESDNDYKRFGFCYIFGSHLKETIGNTSMSFTGDNGKLIAQLNFDYLIINPIEEHELSQISSQNSWKVNTNALDIGHRGAGIARRTDRVENILENTIASFNFASLHGADMVEMDVHLSKDKIPFIYHDFNVNIIMKNKKSKQESEFHEMAVKELTHKQLQILELSPVIKANKSKYDFGDDENEENKPFASLRRVLELVDPKVGFNVEIKYPQQKICGLWEAEITFELNEYVDIILNTLFDYSGHRNIILSCFHPDICSMLKVKQNRYPVLFLTQGLTKKWKQFKDWRNSSIEMAAYFALSMKLYGINVHAEDVIKDRTLIKFVKSKKLALFCWGEDLNNTQLISELKKEGLDGVIYDRIDLLSQKVHSVNQTRD